MLQANERDALCLLAQLYIVHGFPDRAAILYAALEILEPGNPVYVRAQALAHARAGRFEKSLAALDRLALAGEVDEPFHSLRAQVLGSLGRLDEAQASMRAYLTMREGRSAVPG